MSAGCRCEGNGCSCVIDGCSCGSDGSSCGAEVEEAGCGCGREEGAGGAGDGTCFSAFCWLRSLHLKQRSRASNQSLVRSDLLMVGTGCNRGVGMRRHVKTVDQHVCFQMGEQHSQGKTDCARMLTKKVIREVTQVKRVWDVFYTAGEDTSGSSGHNTHAAGWWISNTEKEPTASEHKTACASLKCVLPASNRSGGTTRCR